MEMISGLYLKIKFYLKKLFYIKSYIYLPCNPKHDDIYLVEYPKSGVTWLSTIIGNINLIESDQKQQITYFNLHQYIPDIHTSRELSEFPLWSFPNCRFIKSHDVYNHNYNFIIYIIRDPYRVMNSYYNFMKNLNSFNGDFDEFVLSKKFGIDAWLNHINSWLTKGVTNQKIHVIKYENLLNNPFNEIKILYKNLGLKVNDETIKKSISLGDISSMQSNEELHKNYNPNYSNFNFVGEGKKTFESNISEKIKKIIHERSKIK